MVALQHFSLPAKYYQIMRIFNCCWKLCSKPQSTKETCKQRSKSRCQSWHLYSRYFTRSRFNGKTHKHSSCYYQKHHDLTSFNCLNVARLVRVKLAVGDRWAERKRFITLRQQMHPSHDESCAASKFDTISQSCKNKFHIRSINMFVRFEMFLRILMISTNKPDDAMLSVSDCRQTS